MPVLQTAGNDTNNGWVYICPGEHPECFVYYGVAVFSIIANAVLSFLMVYFLCYKPERCCWKKEKDVSYKHMNEESANDTKTTVHPTNRHGVADRQPNGDQSNEAEAHTTEIKLVSDKDGVAQDLYSELDNSKGNNELKDKNEHASVDVHCNNNDMAAESKPGSDVVETPNEGVGVIDKAINVQGYIPANYTSLVNKSTLMSKFEHDVHRTINDVTEESKSGNETYNHSQQLNYEPSGNERTMETDQYRENSPDVIEKPNESSDVVETPNESSDVVETPNESSDVVETPNEGVGAITKAITVQVYIPANDTTLVHNACEELISKVMSEFEPKSESDLKVDYKYVQDAASVNPTDPLSIVCVNKSRLGTDAKNAVKGFKLSASTVLVILHCKEEHALPEIRSDKVLYDRELEGVGGIYDFAYTKTRGIYDCEMNKTSIRELQGFIRNFKKIL